MIRTSDWMTADNCSRGDLEMRGAGVRGAGWGRCRVRGGGWGVRSFTEQLFLGLLDVYSPNENSILELKLVPVNQ